MPRIAGVMRLHDFPLAVELAIPSLAEHVDALFFLAHDTDNTVMHTVAGHPKCEKLAVYHGPWHNPALQNEAFKLAAPWRPDYVVYIDEDEILPGRFAEEFDKFVACGEKIWSMACWYFQCWNDPGHIIADNCYRVSQHAVALRWRKDIDFMQYAGWDWPSAYYRQKKYRSPYPLRHLAFMAPPLRIARDGRQEVTSRGDTGSWWRAPHPSIPYDPDMTWGEYLAQAELNKPLATEDTESTENAD